MIGRTLIILCSMSCLISSQGIAQRKGHAKKTTEAVQTPKADSVNALMRALDRKDTTALRRMGVLRSPASAGASPRRAHLAMLARVDLDSIVLRWAPSTPGSWIETRRYGYVLERVTVGKNGKPLPGSLRQLGNAPMKPWSLDEWKSRARRDDRFAAVAAQALYGEDFKQQSDVPAGVAMRSGAEELEGRFGFALFAADNEPLVADGLALRYVDHAVKQGEQYVYRLRMAVRDTSYHLDTAYTAASPARPEPPPPPLDLSAEGFDRHITLRWKEYPAGLAYSGYNVYRSEDGGKTFRKLNENPVVTPYRVGTREQMMPNYTDTNVVNYRSYTYEVRGITPFAEVSTPARIEAHGTDRTPPPRPVILKPVQLGRHAVKVAWQMPDTAKGIAGFVVSRSAADMQGYTPITLSLAAPSRRKKSQPPSETQEIMRQLLPASSRSFIDTAARSAEPYYMVAAVNTAGNLSQSLPAYAAIIDSIPPRMPTGLAGTIDTNGIVHLHWHLGAEPNIIGYRVVWANDPRHEFTQRTPRPVKDTVFADTINLHTLTRYIYYRIAAVNDRFIHSPLSPILGLRRPDIVPPGSPVFTSVTVSDTSIALSWAASSSEDIRSQSLLRRAAGDTSWLLLASLDPRAMSYVDRAVVKRRMYEYSLIAIDSSGLRSLPASPVQGRPYDTGVRPGVSGLKLSLDPKGRSIRLAWGYRTTIKERYWFVIYRAYGANGLTQYQSVEGTTHSFQDRDLVGKGRYRYAVRVQTDLGGISPLSAPQAIDVK